MRLVMTKVFGVTDTIVIGMCPSKASLIQSRLLMKVLAHSLLRRFTTLVGGCPARKTNVQEAQGRSARRDHTTMFCETGAARLCEATQEGGVRPVQAIITRVAKGYRIALPDIGWS